MRVIVAGSRDITDAALVAQAIAESGFAPSVVIHGACRGVDLLAQAWAEARGIPFEPYPADWARYGDSAGPRRNRHMAYETEADAFVGLWNGRQPRPDKLSGTQGMAKLSREAGLAYHFVRVPDWRVWAGPGLSRFERNRRRDVPPDLFSR